MSALQLKLKAIIKGGKAEEEYDNMSTAAHLDEIIAASGLLGAIGEIYDYHRYATQFLDPSLAPKGRSAGRNIQGDILGPGQSLFQNVTEGIMPAAGRLLTGEAPTNSQLSRTWNTFPWHNLFYIQAIFSAMDRAGGGDFMPSPLVKR